MSAALAGCVEPAARGSSSDLQGESRYVVVEDYNAGSETPEPTVTEVMPVDPNASWAPQRELIQDIAPDDSGALWVSAGSADEERAGSEPVDSQATANTPNQAAVADATDDTLEAPGNSGSDTNTGGLDGNSEGSSATTQNRDDAAPDGQSGSPNGAVQDPASVAGNPTSSVATQIVTAAPPEIVEPVINDNPERLMGMDTGDLTQMLGNPGFVRRDDYAQLWRYRNSSCVLDLFLYRHDSRPEYLVSHVEARGSNGGDAEKRKCFGALLLEKFDREAS